MLHDQRAQNKAMQPKRNNVLSREDARKYKKAKDLVNVGEMSKATTTILSNGTAEINNSVLEQLRAKHPLRKKEVRLPTPEEINEERESNKSDSRIEHELMKLSKDKKKSAGPDRQMSLDHKPIGIFPLTRPDKKNPPIRTTVEENKKVEVKTSAVPTFPIIIITADDVIAAVKGAKRLTSGGLQQITPWLLKRALLATPKRQCATAAAVLATRWARGDFDCCIGELLCESKLIALYKSSARSDV